jgi:type I protein arginine methyltransferase
VRVNITFANTAPHNYPQVDGVSDTSSTSDPLDTRDDEGWEDLENDEESITFKSLFDDQTFSTAQDMLAYCRDHHSFDIWKMRQELGE